MEYLSLFFTAVELQGPSGSQSSCIWAEHTTVAGSWTYGRQPIISKLHFLKAREKQPLYTVTADEASSTLHTVNLLMKPLYTVTADEASLHRHC
ncbi:unnamed protein product [Boreogadus saida]